MKVGSDMAEESIYLCWLSQKILLRVFERSKKWDLFNVLLQNYQQVTIAPSTDFVQQSGFAFGSPVGARGVS